MAVVTSASSSLRKPLTTSVVSAVRPIWRTLEGKIGITLLTVLLAIIIVGPLVAPYSPVAIGVGLPSQGPSPHHLLGTDSLGRDVLSRFLYGGRSVIGVPLVASALAMLVGGSAGMIAAYRGGIVDALATRVLDVLLALPPLLIVLVVMTAAGTSDLVVIVSVTLVYSSRIARVLRGATQGVIARDYVQAAQARGEGSAAIIAREVFPNVLPTILVEFAVRFSYTIIFVATLDFLGLGLQPPSSNWGVMASDGQATLAVHPLEALVPTFAIGLLAMSVGLIADAATHIFGIRESGGELLG